MADKIVLSAEPRSDVGKGASRRLRRLAGRVPGIIYGGGQEPRNVSLSQRELLKAMEAEAFFSQVLDLKVAGETIPIIVKDLQRHPAHPSLLHIDLLRIRADRDIHVNIPIHLLNEEECKGVRLGGGRLSHHIMEVEVVCLPGLLPEYFEVDVANLELGDSVHLSDLAIPEGVVIPELALGEDHDQPIVSVEASRVMAEEEPEAEGEAKPAEGDKKED